MKKILTALMGMLVILGMFSTMVFAWMENWQIEQIERRIGETEQKLLELDKRQLLDRINWTDWGIEILAVETEEMEKEIQEERKSWEELKKAYTDSETAWKEWERVGYRLDELDRKSSRIKYILVRLKRLKDRLKRRLAEIDRGLKIETTRRLFRLGVVAGVLDFGSVAELQIETSLLDVFYGSRRDKYPRIVYFGIKKGLRLYQSESLDLEAPAFGAQVISIENGKEGIEMFLGAKAKLKWAGLFDREREKTELLLEIRYAFGEEPNLWLGIGLVI